MTPSGEFIRVALVDDHAVVREGYRRLIERSLDLRVVGEAHDADSLFALVAEAPIDVLLLDISLPGISGIEITRRLKAKYPTIAVLISSMHDAPVFAERALEAGALGYITKACDPETLLSALRKVALGVRFLSRDIREQLLEDPREVVPAQALSAKEFEILRRIIAGDTLETIATGLSLSPKTIANYQTSIKQKLNVESSAQLFGAAARLGLLPNTP